MLDRLDRGFFITRAAVRRQLAAMACDMFVVRLIHHATRRAFPGERMWTASLLTSLGTIGFFRIRNRQGWDIYLQPLTDCGRNAGYILLDLDRADMTVVDHMRAQGHEPCVVLQTSPGHLQAWVHVSRSPLEPALATTVAKQLARAYGGDLASADWRHLGRLAGFTNQKPQRRLSGDYAPWVKVVHARAGLAAGAEGLLQSATDELRRTATGSPIAGPRDHPATGGHSAEARQDSAAPSPVTPAEATQIYQRWVQRWRIAERFPQTDWSIVDLWIARQLLSQGTSAAHVQAILQLGSPHFPRRHGNPQDYLRRTLARAAVPRPAPPVCGMAGNTATETELTSRWWEL